jgi:uncharacterized membrane protein YagU involved in acid resistance
MSDIAFSESGAEVVSPGRPRAFDTIVYGGLTAGVLDISYAIIFFGIRNGAKPARILQSVASGLLGRDAARAGGLKTALLGLFLHFLNAFIIATIFYGASRILPTLIRHAVIWGLLYGVAVYFVMNYIVIPLSAIGPGTGSAPWAVFLSGLIVHAFLIGLPIALFAKRSARTS